MRALFLASVPLIVSFANVPARAVDCGNVTAKGVCQDAKTLVFCEDGELEVIRCQVGELCAYDDERFSGAAGCIATRYAGCGAVPEQGLCAGSTLLYCANGRVEELECPAGTSCQSVTQDGVSEFDCVVAGGVASEPNSDSNEEIPVEPGEDSDGVDDPTPVETNGGAPLPSVQKGGAGPAADYEAGGGSCQGGPAPGLALAIAGLALLGRRKLVSARR